MKIERENTREQEIGADNMRYAEKRTSWEAKMKDVEQIEDIDEKIKETVVAFRMLGFPTSGSCEGHADEGSNGPWIRVQAVDMPKERFVGEQERYEIIAEKYGIDPEDVRRGIHEEAQDEFWEEERARDLRGEVNEETEQFKEWRKENDNLREKCENLIEEFYSSREVPEDARIVIVSYADGVFDMSNMGAEGMKDELSDDEKEARQAKLLEYQAEMQAFTEFLKNKYFTSETE